MTWTQEPSSAVWNLRRIELFNGVNMLGGYRMIDIRTPREVIEP